MLHESDRFRPDNTEGYNLHQLEELNRRYEDRAAREMPAGNVSEMDARSFLDRLAEKIQAEYDSEMLL